MPAPNKIHITTRKPQRPDDPGEVAVGYYTYANDVVTLTDANGEPVPGGWNAELQNDETPSTIARSLLRQQRSLSKRARGFNGPISYPRRSFV
jgi:hypothetical protein